MKAHFFLPTLLILASGFCLPKLNSANPAKADHQTAGKIIKAASIGTDFLHALLPTDTTDQPTLQISRRKGSYDVRTVVIDPGHGGHDPGCHGASAKEKHVCLAVGKFLAEAIQENFPDVKVIMTRSTDVFIPLKERAAIATRNKADLFISIHCNAIVNASKTMGTETYVLGLHATEANLAVAKRENEAILLEEDYEKNYDGYDPNSTEAHIMFSMFQNAFLEQSLSFADKVQHYSTQEAKRKHRGVKQAGFIVLKYATMPSVLVETGFLTNNTDEGFLRSKAGQRTMANALLLAFRDYKEEMEGGGPLAIKKLEVDNIEEAIGPLSNDPEMPVADEPAEDVVMVKPVKQSESAAMNTRPEKKEKPTERKNMPKDEAFSEKVEPAKAQKPVAAPPKETAQQSKPSKQEGSSAGKIHAIEPVSESGSVAAQSAEIQYRVQLAASPKPLETNAGKWNNVGYLIQVIEEKGLYKYQVVNFATESEAVAAKAKLRSVGFSDAFVVMYQNGVRLK
ncbi:MAG: N-acetylmuramoyl-L-alanine amidase [Saprospiraceae bacterium]|nr:N-acetylmuramoyl-L-alanine amidase [Saprospiraceae bacterium]